ncbi:hypothetical protein ACFVWY_21035 [Streptomyces sp. NPDC058195]|uniref:hypothetical protein n=1 Tax=Streptomyces sp. NPDC058195 TaxID=3346375 RepID=UPI0036E08179
MNRAKKSVGYRCEVLAVEFFGDTGQMARYVLGTFETISPVLAVRWLGGQALWIADRLNDDPESGPRLDLEGAAWVQSLRRLPIGSTPNRPVELRAWYADRKGQREAQAHLKGGNPLLVVVPDTDCTYTLSAHPA